MKKVCIYGSARDSINRKHLTDGTKLGKLLARNGYGLVFGAGMTGLMGAVNRGIKEAGGHSIGVTPHFMSDFEPIGDCSEVIYTETMHDRKKTMEELANAFIITPGGIGTYDEFFEILTLTQLKRSNKPIVIWNSQGCYDTLIKMLEEGIANEFIAPYVKEMYFVAETPEEVIGYLTKTI